MKKNFTQRSVTFTLALGGLLLAACSPDAGLENLNEVDNFKTLDLQAQWEFIL